MPINVNTIPPPRRKTLIKLGEQFSSQDTLDQANQTLGAYAKHAAALLLAGFAAKHAQELTEARDGLVEAGVGRETAKGKKKTTGKAYVDAMNIALSARLLARAVLAGAREDLEGRTDEAHVRAERAAEVVLEQTSAAPDKAELLAQQLAQLLATLKTPDVATETTDQGGPEAVAHLETAIVAVRKADQEDVGVRGTPMETEALDLLDGIIVQLVRRARRAAQAVARATGNLALVDEFRLDKLYRSRGGKAPEEDEKEEKEGEEKETGKTGEKAAEKTADKAGGEKAAEKAAEKPTEKVAEKAVEKPADKATEKVAEKAGGEKEKE